MSYTPKHAKPASAKTVALSAYHGAFGPSDAMAGRHVRRGHAKTHRPQAAPAAPAPDQATPRAA